MKRIFYIFSLSISFLLTGMDNSSIANVSAAHLISAMKDNNFLLAKHLLSINPHIMHEEITLDWLGNITTPFFSRNTTTPFYCSPNKKWSQLFIENGADVNRQNNDGETLLNRICADPFYYFPNKKWLQLFIENDADVNRQNSKEEIQLNHICAEDIIKCDTSHALYLINCGANVNNVNHCGNSILHNIILYNKRCAPAWIHFLLQHNVNINKQNKDGKTAFDLAIMRSDTVAIKCFEKAGIMFFSFNDYNPYDLLKNNAYKFKEALENGDHKMVCRLANLFMFIKKCHKKNDLYKAKNSSTIHLFYGYIFKNTAMYELQQLAGKEGISYAKTHCKNICKTAEYTLLTLNHLGIFIKIIKEFPFIMNYSKKLRSKIYEYIISNMKHDVPEKMIYSLLKHTKNINFVDYNDNNLLHRAVLAHNVPLFKLLMHSNCQHEIDFTKKNNVGLTPLGIAKKHNYTKCIEVFYEKLSGRLAHISKNDVYCKQVLQFLNEECDINRLSATKESLLFNLALYPCANLLWYSFLIQKGAKINIQNYNRQSPLNRILHSYQINLNSKLKKIIKVIKLFIANGAIVTKTMLNDTNNEEIKKILQKAYDEQACCICMENPVGMNEIPCNNTHKRSFLCTECYENIKQQNNLCPLDRQPLNEYQAFK